MPIVPLEGFGVGGLITDVPKESMSMQFFDECLNMKSKYGELTGVASFDISTDTLGKLRTWTDTNDGASYADNLSIKPADITQWTRGSETYLDVLTLGYTSGGSGVIYLIGGEEGVGDADKSNISVLTSEYGFTYNSAGTQTPYSFIFNEMCILDLEGKAPQYSNDKAVFQRIPNWLSESYGSTTTTIVAGNIYEIAVNTDPNWSAYGGPSAAVVGSKFDSTFTGDIGVQGSVRDCQPYVAERVALFNGRLIALNLSNDLGDGNAANDITKSITIAYSSSIAARNSLAGVEWYASATNSAGDVILSESPGRIVDAKQLGDYLMVYKTDAVVRLFDTGAPFYLTGETVFLDDGVMSEDCVVDMGGNKHFVVGNYGLYMHTGGPESMVVSDKKIEHAFYDDLATSAADRALTFAFHDTLEKEIWVCYRDVSQNTADADKACTKAIVFDYIEGTFHKRDLNNLNDIIEVEIDGVQEVIAASLDETAGLQTTAGLHLLAKNNSAGNKTKYVADGFVRFNARTLDSVGNMKELSALYPTSENSFNVKVYSDDVPTVKDMSTEVACPFDPTLDYKEDFREAGRYYTIEINMNGAISPQISDMKVDMLEGGFR
jgi:hypothetical protein